jgi:hypothetical protein
MPSQRKAASTLPTLGVLWLTCITHLGKKNGVPLKKTFHCVNRWLAACSQVKFGLIELSKQGSSTERG